MCASDTPLITQKGCRFDPDDEAWNPDNIRRCVGGAAPSLTGPAVGSENQFPVVQCVILESARTVFYSDCVSLTWALYGITSEVQDPQWEQRPNWVS